MKQEIFNVPIDQIRILNPRHRDAKKFSIVVDSIRDLGLKKPIKISRRRTRRDDEPTYDLVYGQGRLEAFKGLGYRSIPAIIVDISKDERLLLSLVENMARRFPRHADLIDEIQRLHAKKLSNSEIGRRLGLSDTTIAGYLALAESGEQRLLEAALRGSIPVGVAMDIAKVNDVETQRAFLTAYENKQLKQGSIRAVKRLIEQRRLLGKTIVRGQAKNRTTAESLVHTYRKLSQQQRATVNKGKTCERKLVFLVTALKKLLRDQQFRALLRSEKIETMPEFLARRVESISAEAV